MTRLTPRPEIRFLILFLTILVVSFAVVGAQPVNDGIVVPYTACVARLSGAVLGWLGEDITVNGCDVSSHRFSVTIFNGCNGLITSLVLVAGILAFPAPWRSKVVGVLLGMVAIQIINLVRIVALFYTGVFLPRYFNQSHVFVWQSVVIVFGVALWIGWARWTRTSNRESG